MRRFADKVTVFATLALLSWTCSAAGQGTTRFITFDGPPLQARGTAREVQDYLESGMWFRPATNSSSFVRQGGGYSGYPENGTAYLQAAFGCSLTFGFTDGSVFDLVSGDLAEYSTVFSFPFTAYFIGYRQDGTVVTNSLTTDGIIDGTGPLQDFQTFQFSSEMRNLDRVEVPLWSWGWSLDNLEISIPEPSTGALSVLAFATCWIAMRRSRR